jgi:hypothetical protein
MVANLRHHAVRLSERELYRRLEEARRSGDRELQRRLADEIVKTRKQVD